MREFAKRHKFLSALFIISIFFMIKNSSIPYPFNVPSIIQRIFNAPTSEFFSGVADMVDIFTSAYVTSLLFYYIVDYRHAIKEEYKAKDIIAPKLVNLYLYLSELLAMVEYSCKRQGLWQGENNKEMDDLQFEDSTIFCKRKTINNKTESGTGAHLYNLRKDSDKYRRLILDTCKDITGTPSFSYCDPDLVHIISEIQLSELLRLIPHPNDPFFQCNIAVSHIGLADGYNVLLEIKKKLEPFVNRKLECTMIDISDKELEKWLTQNAQILSNHPEIAKLLSIQEMQDQ